jgi:hypothetical protein
MCYLTVTSIMDGACSRQRGAGPLAEALSLESTDESSKFCTRSSQGASRCNRGTAFICQSLFIIPLGKAVNDVGDVVRGVFKLAPCRYVCLAKPGQIRRDDVETIGQQRNQVAKHVPRAGEAVKQQQL